jgi:hypothetical protein
VREWFISPHGARVKPSIFAPSINRRAGAAIPRQLSNRFTDDRTGPAECEGIANSVRIGRTRTTGCHVEIAFGIEFLDVDRG